MNKPEVREGPNLGERILLNGDASQRGLHAVKWIVATLAVIGALTLVVGIGVGVAKALEWLW